MLGVFMDSTPNQRRRRRRKRPEVLTKKKRQKGGQKEERTKNTIIARRCTVHLAKNDFQDSVLHEPEQHEIHDSCVGHERLRRRSRVNFMDHDLWMVLLTKASSSDFEAVYHFVCSFSLGCWK